MHPVDELFSPELWQLDLIERLNKTSKIYIDEYPETFDRANEIINELKQNQLDPITEIGKYSLTQLNLFIKKKLNL